VGFEQGANISVGQLRRVALVEHGKVEAIEANQPFLGSQPNITVSRLDDRCHIVFRQSLLLLPDFVNVLRQGFGWIEGLGRGVPEAREDERKKTCPCQD
jgi:hypothetical protein